MYKFNQEVTFPPPPYPTPRVELASTKIYYTTRDYVEIELPDIFRAYPIVLEKDSWEQYGGDRFGYFRSQLNFAVYCATTALGVTYQHLTEGSELLKSFYRFHTYYHVRRVLKKLGAPLPHDAEFSKFKNRYDRQSYHSICREYEINPNQAWIYGNWATTASGARFHDNGMKSIWIRSALPTTNYCQNMPLKGGEGLKNLNFISESVRVYAYLILNSQISGRGSMKSPAARQIFPGLFEDIVKRALNTADDIARFEGVITRSRSKLDFPVAEGVYMLPSDMSLINGKINGFNNAIKVAGANVKIGEINTSVNQKRYDRLAAQQEHQQAQKRHDQQEHQQAQHDRLAVQREHEEEKEALIVVGVSVIIGIIWFSTPRPTGKR